MITKKSAIVLKPTAVLIAKIYSWVIIPVRMGRMAIVQTCLNFIETWHYYQRHDPAGYYLAIYFSINLIP